MMEKRLNAYLSRAGLASRRAAVTLIRSGRVKVNGQVIQDPSCLVHAYDHVVVDDIPVKLPKTLIYLLYKPPGYLCSSAHQDARPIVTELIPCEERIFSVGRLDYMTAGLLILTNDGDFAQCILHPSKGIEKEYLLCSSNPIPTHMLKSYSRGISIDGQHYRLAAYKRETQRRVRLVLIEGKNREIRRICRHYSLHIQSITRIRIGPIRSGTMKEGQYRRLSESEIDRIRRMAAGDRSH